MCVVACGDNLPGNVAIDVPVQWQAAVADEIAFTPSGALSMGGTAPYQIHVVDDPAIPAEGWQIVGGPMQFDVHAHDILGAQYGVADALENLGFRFRHPYDTFVPIWLRDEGGAGPVHAPQIRVRGLHLHTLHTIEGYFALWEPSVSSTKDAHRIIDWVIKNRGNYIQWAALNDIIKDPAKYAAWQPFTQELIDYAHSRGVRVGIDFELLGQGNLQDAFDLVDDSTMPAAPQIGMRLPLLTQLPFDVFDLSFGEFVDSDPQLTVDMINDVASQLRTDAPTAEMHALVHVGAKQIVSYMGMNIIFYFLVKYADPTIVPDIHTVMYYDLFEDAGGAYQSPDFSQHRQYLEDRMCAHQKAAYHPEDAYWVAFDDSVPMFDPIYVHSRLLDLSMLAQSGCAPLDEHLIFSSGWEWGYWLNDYAALRASYELADPATIIHDAYTPDLGDAAAIVDDLASIQHDGLMRDHLAGYMAGRDAIIDAGRQIGIISQPDRITFDQLTADMVGSFTDSVITPLTAHADAMDALAKKLDRLSLPDTRWAREISDGLTIDRLRARFVLATYAAVIAHLTGGDTKKPLSQAQSILAQAKTVVGNRHHDLHDTHGKQLTGQPINDTSFQYAYLHLADTLCYWRRELTQVENILGTSTAVPSSCFFGSD
jgi:hypothetical protein